MQFKNVTRANIVLVEGKLCLELPDELVKHLNLSISNSLDVALGKQKIVLWKSLEREIPQDIYDELYKLFKGNEPVISEWLSMPRIDFEGKTAMELIDSAEGIQLIKTGLLRLKSGDF